jgi:CBS domain containing-hemolysin-like protein
MTVLPWVIVALLVAVNALYVAAEFSVVAVQRSQLMPIARGGNGRAAGLLAVLEDGAELDRYIAACQIGITLSSLVAGAYAQATIGLELGPLLEAAFALSSTAAQSSAFVLVLLILTTLQVLLGELVPKSLALQYPEQTALATYLPTRWSASLYRAFIWLLNGSGLLLLKPFGVKAGGQQHVHSPEEIRILLAESQRGGTLSPDAHRQLERALQLSARTVRQMMTPRSDMYAIDISAPAEEVLQRILESPYSRVPVYQGSLDHILGAVNIKDVATSFAVRGEVSPLDKLIRPIPFVPESLRAHRFVRFLQEQQSSKAIVVDEFGGVHGIISIEDVLSQLFGELGDELKQPDPGAEPLEDGTVRLPGFMGLDEAEPWLGTRWEGSAATVGGHVIAQLGRLPIEGEQLSIDGVLVTVTEMSPTTVRSIVVHPFSDPLDAGAELAASERD